MNLLKQAGKLKALAMVDFKKTTYKISPQKKGTDIVGTLFLKHNFFKLFEIILKKFYFQTFKIKAFSFCRNKFSEKEDYIQQQ